VNLKIHLLLHIILIAAICLLATGGYVLFQVNREVKHQAAETLDAASNYLGVQLSGMNPNGQQTGHFPDFELWKQAYPISGVCLRYVPSNQRTFAHSLCQGEAMPIQHWPKTFENCYLAIFSVGIELTRKITFKDVEVGSITVIPSAQMELAKAWDRIKGLLGLAASTTLAVCAWVYFAIQQALRPARTIINSLEQMQHDNTYVFLPPFKLFEWQRIGSAINHFVITQKQMLSDRKKLVLQLMSVQEEERTFLARELHDELGQCLTGINALSASIILTAQQESPKIVAEAESIARVNQRVMETVSTLLMHLRPAELNELGLEVCLQTMVDEWNNQLRNRRVCGFTVHGESRSLKPPLPIVLFRIVQEGLSNIAKHADATEAAVRLEITRDDINLLIEDNGKLNVFPFTENRGMGLLGMRKRVMGLDGDFQLDRSALGGLRLRVTLPIADEGLRA
jgi:two-component system, NarL family, sensor histidine kinase UhpB